MASKFKIIQNGIAIEYSFYLDNLVVNVPQIGGIFSFNGDGVDNIGSINIISTKGSEAENYVVITQDSWITMKGKTCVFEPNTGSTKRTGTVVFTQNESLEMIKITFIQEVVLTYTFTFMDGSINKRTIYSSTDNIVFVNLLSFSGNVKDNTIENVTHDSLPFWITSMSLIYGTPVGELEFHGNMEINETGFDRSAIINFTQGTSGKKVQLVVEQAAKETIRIPYEVNINFRNDSNTNSYERLMFSLGNTVGENYQIFNISEKMLAPGETHNQTFSGAIEVLNTFTSNTCSFKSASGINKKENYVFSCNGDPIINITINTGDDSFYPMTNDVWINGDTLHFTGDVYYIDNV